MPEGIRLISLDARKVMFSVPAYLRYLRIARPSVVLSSVENASIVSCIGKMLSSHCHRLLVRLDNSLSEPGILPLQMHRWPVMTAIASTFHAADAFVAVSGGLKEQLGRLPGLSNKPIRAIYNPIIHEGFEAQADLTPALPSSIKPGEPFVLAVGRLHKQKGYRHLLLAFARVVKQRPSHLVILGEGHDREELQGLASSFGIAPYVHFLGYASNPLAYMRHAAVFLSCHRSPRVLAMSLWRLSPAERRWSVQIALMVPGRSCLVAGTAPSFKLATSMRSRMRSLRS